MFSLEVIALIACCFGMIYWAKQWLLARNGNAYKALDTNNNPAVVTYPPKSSPLSRWLYTLDIQMSPSLFMLGLLILALLFFMLALTFFPQQWLAAGCVFVGSWIASIYGISEMAALKVRRFEAGLVPALDLMKASLIGGLAPRQAIIATASVSKTIVKDELLELVKRLEFGATVKQALARLLGRYNSEGARLFAQALIAHYRSGGDFTAMLSSVSQLLTDRHYQRLEIEGQLSASRYAAIFAGVLPYLIIPLLLWKQPDWLDPIKNHPQGPTWVVIAALCQIIGFLWLRKILRIK